MGQDDAILRGDEGFLLRNLLCNEPCRIVDGTGESRYAVFLLR
jgi:hypothetical protein